MRFSFLPIVILMMPILEIAGFIVVGKALGLWLTLGLVLFTSFLGLMILRSGGLGMVRDLQNAGRTGEQPAQAMISGGLRVIAAGPTPPNCECPKASTLPALSARNFPSGPFRPSETTTTQ